MDITPLIPEGQKVIQRYGAYKFHVNEQVYEEPILVLAHQVVPWKGEEDKDYSDALTILSKQQDRVEVVLFGVGDEVRHLLPSSVKQALKEYGMATDIMNTGAACRTYNILLAEGRKVAALLIPVE